MSDLAATGCGCGGSPISGSGNRSCNVLLWILILSCACGGEGGIFGNSLFGGNGCGDGCGCGCGGNNWLWIIILIALIG